VWAAVAHHSKPGIPQQMHPIMAHVTSSLEIGVLGLTHPEYSNAGREAGVRTHPHRAF
jgi:hypothetical protein